jgi:hypothetical protein
MDTSTFKTNPGDCCKTSKIRPDQESVKKVIKAAWQRPIQAGNAIIIARHKWLIRNKIPFPERMYLPNLCIFIKNGNLKFAFYSNILTHVIKKQNYHIQIIN